ncbi:FecR family protein [Uliginosibacterium paludis]|uniref:FecR domain-containing protein n=1 Tax=Uliginosibacterium paludis TaxID=1615952 RepID=A0ABV2CS08_9RHOO
MNPLPADPLPADSADAEAREFEDFARSQDPVELEAATWALRRRNGLDAEGERALADWLAADPRHGEALDDMDRTFGDLQQLPAGERAALRQGLAGPARLPGGSGLAAASGPVRGTVVRPRSWAGWLELCLPHAALAALAFVVCGAAWFGWQAWRQQPLFEQTYATVRGQQLAVVLPDAPADGSRVALDTATRLDVSLYRAHREVRLEEGEAMFSVHHDTERPFHVTAGGLRITVVGTRFSVRHAGSGRDAGQTVVEVEEGRVRVASADPATTQPERLLTAGQRLVVDGHDRFGEVTPLSAASVAAWRSGRVSFDQTPLADAIAEFERYGPTGLVVRDPAVAALKVGGSFGVGQSKQFARALPQILPVRLVARGGLTEVVADTP